MDVSDQCHAPCHFTPREKACGIDWIGGWEGPKAGLNIVEKRKISNQNVKQKTIISNTHLMA
jgi:hypothetical protein